MVLTFENKQEIQNLYQENTLVEETYLENTPKENFLCQNYPNPFNSQTTIRYQLEQSGYVSIKIFDILGQTIRTLVEQEKSVGIYTVHWDGKNDSGVNVVSGTYFYEMKSNKFCEKRKLVILR